MPRLLVVVPARAVPRVAPGPEVRVLSELDLVKCHSVEEVRAAAGCSFVTISPVAATQTKPGYGPALGVDGVRAAVEAAGFMPVFALGGVTVDNARSFVEAGASGVAVMGAVLRAADPYLVVRQLLAALGG
jgi:thiamine-phosphate pyrophosphorylase